MIIYLAALEVVIMMTSNAAGDEKFITWQLFCFTEHDVNKYVTQPVLYYRNVIKERTTYSTCPLKIALWSWEI